MTSLGDTLRRERLRRNLEVVGIASELKIAARFLEAIEAGDFAKLPGGVFTKSFVRQYAAYLGLDSQEMAAEVQRAVEPLNEQEQIPDKPKPDVSPIKIQLTENWHSVSDRRTSLPPWITSGALLIGLMLVCSAVYWWWGRVHHPTAPAEIPPAVSHVAPPPPTPVAPAASEPAATPPVHQPEPAPAAAEPASTTASEAPPAATPKVAAAIPPNPNATVRVGITANEQVWMSAYVNDKYLFSGTLQPHEVRDIDADGEVRVRLGNAGGVSITLNGKPVDAVGPKGQPRTVQFTSGGLKIVSPPKSLDPLDRL